MTFDLLLYDVTLTYFEGQMAGNPQGRHGHSRDGRPDCVQVCIALVVTPEGLPLACEVFAASLWSDMSDCYSIRRLPLA